MQHLVAWLIGSSALLGYLLAYLIHNILPGLLSKGEVAAEKVLDIEIGKLSPAEKEAILAADKYIDSAIPGNNNAKYAAVVAMLVTKVPQLAPFASVLAEALSEVGVAAKTILENEQGPLSK